MRKLSRRNNFLLYIYIYHLQYERTCCIGYTNSSGRREVVCPIQHGREYCNARIFVIIFVLNYANIYKS